MGRRCRICSRDHPRIRGEHGAGPAVRVGDQGSSPHTRGARLRQARPRRAARIIPAYAGSTGMLLRPAETTADHPRIRGEHPPESETSARKPGSSPHTRGARRRPAWSTGGVTDHPRIRGEHVHLQDRHHESVGSSPHTRGAHRPMRPQRTGTRIIPAYAGSTRRSLARRIQSPDHPRIRGEHGSSSATTIWSTGSSPHTRGARVPVDHEGSVSRIIPAYAGST